MSLITGIILISAIIGLAIGFKRKKNDTDKSRNNELLVNKAMYENKLKSSRDLKIGTEQISIDDDKQKIIFSQMPNKAYEFSQINNFELIEDGAALIDGKTGATVAGAALFGLTGAIIGSSGKRKQRGTSNGMALKVYIDDINNPTITLPIFELKNTRKNSAYYKEKLEEAHEIIGVFEYIMNK